MSTRARAAHLLPVAVAVLSMAARPLAAQASATVAPLSALHRDVDRLVAQGIVDTVIVGQRPYSRMAVARMLAQAAASLERLAGVDARRAELVAEIVTRMRHELAPELRLARRDSGGAPLVRRADVDATLLGAPWQRVPVENGLGEIDAEIAPLLGPREGRDLRRGLTVSLEPLLEGRLARALVVVAQPRAAAYSGEGVTEAAVRAERAFARTALGPVALQVGRDHLAWGQGMTGGSMLSTDAPALDLVLLATDGPVLIPLLSRLGGPIAASAYAARLDGRQNFPHPYLVGYKVSALPARWFELGIAVHVKGGGRGAPPASLAERVADLFPLYDVLFKGDDDFQISDKYAGADARLRLAGGAELYGEMLVNDLDFNRLRSSFGEDASHVLGVWLPRLDGVGRVEGSLEVRHTGIRQYRHHQFTSGMTLRGRLLGDPLGPDARGAYASLAWSGSTWTRLTLDVAGEERRADEYTDVTNGAATIDFERTLARPRERRVRAVASWEGAFREGTVRLLLQAGAERTTAADFVEERRITGGLGRVSLSIVPRTFRP